MKKILHLFKKVGSNFLIKDRTVLFEPRGAWKTLLDSGFGGGNALVSALRADPDLRSETLFEKLRKGWDSNPQGRLARRFFRRRRTRLWRARLAPMRRG